MTTSQPFRNETPTDAYGVFEFRARSGEAKKLVERLHAEILATENRKRKRRQDDAERFYEAVERFVGELLRAKARQNGTGRFARAMSERYFSGDVVSYNNVLAIREALKELGYLDHEVGSPKFGPDFEGGTSQYSGEAAKFGATPKLLTLAEELGITCPQIGRHFRREHEPVEARRSSSGDWQGKQRGTKVRFQHTEQMLAMERRVVALNEFLQGFEIAGADHRMFYRLFNECDNLVSYRWNKGGRLYSDSGTEAPSYQNMSNNPGERRALRSRITIDGEPTVELDIASSYLTIFHALVGKPLNLLPTEDPYARIDPDRSLVKGWMTVSFGAGKPCTRWSPTFSKRYAEEHGGVRPTKACPAPVMADKALKAYPALKHVGARGLTWADLMFVESEVLMTAMEALMHRSVPCLPVHDALMVAASDAAEGARALYLSFYHVVGTLPVIKTKSDLEGVRAVVEAVRDEVKDLETKPPRINTRLAA
jgi:hypothetical protein